MAEPRAKPKSPPSEVPLTRTAAEEKKVEERVAISAQVVYETIRREGEEELVRPAAALAWSAIAAGLSMGFSFLAEATLVAYLPPQSWNLLISRFGYCVGFLIVILGRQQLFTENTLTVILPLLVHKNRVTLLRVLRLWAIVLGGNLVGTFLYALCIASINVFDPRIEQAFISIGAAHLGAGFGVVFLRSIFAGWLIALMVWLLPGADSSRVAIIIIITYLVGLAGLNHIIAGSNVMFFLLVKGSLSWGEFLGGFFVPTLIGNIVGGTSLVAALGHAQVVGGKS
jgi:formate-nitrite transporter family protein